MKGIVMGRYDEDEKSLNMQYCPFCGELVYSSSSDGTFDCDSCDTRFSVIEVE